MLLLKLSKFRFVIKNCIPTTSVQCVQGFSSKDDTLEEIIIPNRIERSPTDILRALASTVGTDLTAAHYKYHDDPYLIPMSNVGKRTFALAQESGRKAARWVRQEHKELFQHSVAQPPVSAFSPQMVFTEESEVDNTSLEKLILNAEVSDAIFVYKLMKSKGIAVDDATKQSLLELVSFYNHQEPLSEDLIEERWFRQGNSGIERQRKTWKDADLAEELFNEIVPKNAKSYAAIIRGMCKYIQAERAYALFQEAIDKGIELDTKTYNGIISISSFLRESGELKWEFCTSQLRQMYENGLRPDLGTLNAALSITLSISNPRYARPNALRILNEFKFFNIEPSLGTWYYVLKAFCKDHGTVSHVLVDIMNQIDGKEFKIVDPKDTSFFVTAMDVCHHHLHDKILAKRVHKLLHLGNNYDLIGDSYSESIYYRNYFGLLCKTEPLDVFMETYELLVPNVYIPEPSIMEEVLKAVDTNGAIEYLPKIWSDLIIFDYSERESLLNAILRIMFENKPNPQITVQQNLEERFLVIAWDIFSKFKEPGERRSKIQLTGDMLGNILAIISRAGNMEKAEKVFFKLDKNQQTIAGCPKKEALNEFIELCIRDKLPSKAINALEYCAENGFPNVPELARKINQGFTLNEVHFEKVKRLVGNEIIDS